MATEAQKGWRGCFKFVYRSYDSDICVAAADKTAVKAAACVEHLEEVTPSMDGGLEALYNLGNRLAKEIVEGNIDLTLRLVHHYVDLVFMHLAGIDSSWMLPGKVCVGIFPHGYLNGEPAIYMCGKFSNWNLPINQPDLENEELDFIGECISTEILTI